MFSHDKRANQHHISESYDLLVQHFITSSVALFQFLPLQLLPSIDSPTTLHSCLPVALTVSQPSTTPHTTSAAVALLWSKDHTKAQKTPSTFGSHKHVN